MADYLFLLRIKFLVYLGLQCDALRRLDYIAIKTSDSRVCAVFGIYQSSAGVVPDIHAHSTSVMNQV